MTPFAVFRIWFHWSRFHAMKRSHRSHNKQIKRQRSQDLICEASRCASIHDAQGLYGIIKKYTPKTIPKRIHLRNSHGVLADAVEEQALYRAHILETWQGPDLVSCAYTTAPGNPLTDQQLEAALQSIPIHKATAVPFAPAPMGSPHCQASKSTFDQMVGY